MTDSISDTYGPALGLSTFSLSNLENIQWKKGINIKNNGATSVFGCAISSSGQYQTVLAYGGLLYTSSDYGSTWVNPTNLGSREWHSVSISSTGQYQTAGTIPTLDSYRGMIYVSRDYGNTWSTYSDDNIGSGGCYAVAISATGKYQVVSLAGNNRPIYITKLRNNLDTRQ